MTGGKGMNKTGRAYFVDFPRIIEDLKACLLYTSDAADE